MNIRSILLCSVIALGGCDHFAVSDVSTGTTIAPQVGQSAYDARITPRDLYTVVWAETAAPQGGNALKACSDSQVLTDIFRSRTRLLTVSADIGNNVSLPLYSVTQNGSASCSIALGQVFLTPRQVIDPGLPFRLTGSAILEDSGSERLSEYLNTAVSFANLLTPLGPEVGVVAAGMNTALESAPAKQLSNEANSFMSSKVTLSGTPLVSLDPPQSGSWYEKTFSYEIQLQKYNYANNPVGGPANLGTITIHVWRTSTIIGVDPVTDGGRFGAVPDYSSLSPETQVLMLTSTASGISAVQQNLFSLLDQDASVASAVRNLAPDATTAQVTQACNNLRQRIQNLAILNRLDSAAFLWAVYSWSSYANAHEPKSIPSNYVSPCLTGDEENAVTMLGIGGWPHRAIPTSS